MSVLGWYSVLSRVPAFSKALRYGNVSVTGNRFESIVAEVKSPDVVHVGKYEYQDEVSRLMDRTVNSLYSNKECLSSSESFSSQTLALDIEGFRGELSFDALFVNLVNELIPAFQEEYTESLEGNSNISRNDALSNGRSTQAQSSPLFPEVDSLLSTFKSSCSQLVEL